MTRFSSLFEDGRPGDSDIAQIDSSLWWRNKLWRTFFCFFASRRFCFLVPFPILRQRPELIVWSVCERFVEQGEREYVGRLILLSILVVEFLDRLVVGNQQGEHNLPGDSGGLQCIFDESIQIERSKDLFDNAILLIIPCRNIEFDFWMVVIHKRFPWTTARVV